MSVAVGILDCFISAVGESAGGRAGVGVAGIAIIALFAARGVGLAVSAVVRDGGGIGAGRESAIFDTDFFPDIISAEGHFFIGGVCGIRCNITGIGEFPST